jgi:hypothetical protein
MIRLINKDSIVEFDLAQALAFIGFTGDKNFSYNKIITLSNNK